jgi:CRISPR/Cas system endoribonuclease Cas6 (RAMP superfamily)
MPLSAVIYTNSEPFCCLRDEVRKRFEGSAIKPYTFSFPHKLGTGGVRVRATELSPGALMPLVREMVHRGEATLASTADREVRNAAYEELVADGDRSRRVVALRFASPTVVEVQGERAPFPVTGAIFARYREIWDAFSPVSLPPIAEFMERVHVTDFKISRAAALTGPGAKGWVILEMEKGRTEQEIALFNTLADFAFYCGTGLHTDEGLGQTGRMEARKGELSL